MRERGAGERWAPRSEVRGQPAPGGRTQDGTPHGHKPTSSSAVSRRLGAANQPFPKTFHPRNMSERKDQRAGPEDSRWRGCGPRSRLFSRDRARPRPRPDPGPASGRPGPPPPQRRPPSPGPAVASSRRLQEGAELAWNSRRRFEAPRIENGQRIRNTSQGHSACDRSRRPRAVPSAPDGPKAPSAK